MTSSSPSKQMADYLRWLQSLTIQSLTDQTRNDRDMIENEIRRIADAWKWTTETRDISIAAAIDMNALIILCRRLLQIIDVQKANVKQLDDELYKTEAELYWNRGTPGDR